MLPIWNTTFVLAIPREDDVDANWRNTVHLYNHVRNSRDLTHQYDYTATPDEQKPPKATDAWGPIIETFQASYAQTNPLGVLRTELCSENATAQWGPGAVLPRGSHTSVRMALASRRNSSTRTMRSW